MANNKSKKDSILFTFVGHGKFVHNSFNRRFDVVKNENVELFETKNQHVDIAMKRPHMMKLWKDLFLNTKRVTLKKIKDKYKDNKNVYICLGFDGDPPCSPPAVLVHYLYTELKNNGYANVKIIQVQINDKECDEPETGCKKYPCSLDSYNSYHIDGIARDGYSNDKHLDFIESFTIENKNNNKNENKKFKLKQIADSEFVSLGYKIGENKESFKLPESFEADVPVFTVGKHTAWGQVQTWGGMNDKNPVCSTEVWDKVAKWGMHYDLPENNDNRYVVFFWDAQIETLLGKNPKGNKTDITNAGGVSGETYQYFKPSESNYNIIAVETRGDVSGNIGRFDMYGGARKSKSKRSRRKQKGGKSRRRSKSKKSLRKRRTRRRR